MPDVQEMRIEWEPLSEIVRWPRNPKDHDLGVLSESFGRWGFVQPLLLDENSGRLVAGHGRLSLLQMKKASGEKPPERIKPSGSDWLIPVIRGISFESMEEAEAYLIADNRTSEVGGWLEDELAEVLGDLAQTGFEGTGFDEDDLDVILRDLNPPEKPNKPEVEISPELFERHDYMVLLFDNELDWQRAVETFGIETASTAPVKGKTEEFAAQQKGLGRVIEGAELFRIIDRYRHGS